MRGTPTPAAGFSGAADGQAAAADGAAAEVIRSQLRWATSPAGLLAESTLSRSTCTPALRLIVPPAVCHMVQPRVAGSANEPPSVTFFPSASRLTAPPKPSAAANRTSRVYDPAAGTATVYSSH